MSIVFYVRDGPPEDRPERPKDPVQIHQPEDILPVLEWMGEEDQEMFVVITLDVSKTVIQSRIITVGLLDHSLVHPREVFAPAISDRAQAIIVAHNHPSGGRDPSSHDLAITDQLRAAGKILGIPVLDHIIIPRGGGFVSLAQSTSWI